MALMTALVVAVLTILPGPAAVEEMSGASDVPAFGPSQLDDSVFEPVAASVIDQPSNPIYRHSVVAGGVHSLDDVVSAVAADPVVREHYSNVSIASLKVVRSPVRREAYMSYRIGDKVYWTSKKIALAEGEAVLTDGETTIRARCGNLISDEAMSPTAADEPAASAFDEVETQPAGASGPESRVAGVSGEAPIAPQASSAGDDGAGSSSGAGTPAQSQTFASGGGLVPSGGGVTAVPPAGTQTSRSPGGQPGTNVAGGGPGGNGPGGVGPGGGPGGGSDNLPPGFDFPPGFDNPPGFDDPPGFPPDFPPDGPDGPQGPIPDPKVIDTNPPPDVVPVPEPGSLVLLGTGLALAAWRARRRR